MELGTIQELLLPQPPGGTDPLSTWAQDFIAALTTQNWNQVDSTRGLLTELQDSYIAADAALESSFTSEIGTVVTDLAAVASRVDTLESQVNTPTTGILARITTNETTIATHDTAISSLTTTVSSHTTSIAQNASDIADNATDIGAIDTRVTTTEADIVTNATAIATLDGAVSTLTTTVSSHTTAISTINTTLTTRARVWLQTSAPSSGHQTGDLWLDSDDGYKLYRYSGSSWDAVPDARIAANAANITTNASAITTLDSSLASLTTTVSAHTTSIATNASDIGDLQSDVGTLQGEMTTAQADIVTNATAITTEASARASADTTITASVTTLSGQTLNSNPNLIPDPDNARDTWTLDSNMSMVDHPEYGRCFSLDATGVYSSTTANFPLTAGKTYTLTYEALAVIGGGPLYCDVLCLSSGGGVLLDSNQTASHNGALFTTRPSITFTAPASTTQCKVRVVSQITTSVTTALVRRIKLEEGSTATLWNDDTSSAVVSAAVVTNTADIATNASAIATAESAISSLETTVSAHTSSITAAEGDIDTLQTDMTNAEADIVTNATAITTNASAISTLSSTVSANYTAALVGVEAVDQSFNFALDGELWTNSVSGDPLSVSDPTSATYTDVAGIGPVHSRGGSYNLCTKAVFAPVTGHTYRMSVRLRRTVDIVSGSASISLIAYRLAYDYSAIGSASGSGASTVTVASGWTTISAEWTAATLQSGSAAFIRPRIETNGDSASTVQVMWVSIEDITDVESLDTRVTTTEAAIVTNASAITTNASAISTLSSTVSANYTTLATAAQSARNTQLPIRPYVQADFISAIASTFASPDVATALTAGTPTTVANEGAVLEISTLNYISTRGWLPVRSGRTFRIRSRAGVTVDGSGNRIWSGFHAYTYAGVYLGAVNSTVVDSSAVVADGYQNFEVTTTSTSILAAYATAAYVRGFIYVNVNGSGTISGATTRVAIVQLEDITDYKANSDAITTNTASIATNASAIATETTARAAADTTLTARVAVATQEGLVRNPKFSLGLSSSVPLYWSNWSNGTGSEVARVDESSAYAFRLVGGASANAGVQYSSSTNAIVEGSTLRVRASAKLVSGTYNGAGVLVDWKDASFVSVGTTQKVQFAADADIAGVTSNSQTGLRTWDVEMTAPSGASRFAIYAMSHWSSHSGGNTVANSIDWHQLDLVATSPRLSEVEASVSNIAEAYATDNGSTARLVWTVNTGTNVATLEQTAATGYSDGTWNGSAITLTANEINLAADAINFGADTTFEDTYNSFYTEETTYRYRFGGPFPASGDLLMWFGPNSVSLNSETKTNGVFALATDGIVYFGTGDLSDAVGTNSVFTKTYGVGGFTTSGTTAATIATIDVNDVPASGFIVAAMASLPIGSYTLSSGTSWYGNIIITEDLQAGGSENTLYTIGIQITDTGGGFYDVYYNTSYDAYTYYPRSPVAQTVSGDVRYKMKIQRTSGSNNISSSPGSGGEFIIQRTPG